MFCNRVKIIFLQMVLPGKGEIDHTSSTLWRCETRLKISTELFLNLKNVTKRISVNILYSLTSGSKKKFNGFIA